MFIIAIFLLGFGSCGHKAAPSYEEEVLQGDANVHFTLINKNDTNESCK